MRRAEARWSKIANFQLFSEHMFDRTQRHDKIPDANHKVWSNLWETCVIVTSRRRGGFRISRCDFFSHNVSQCALRRGDFMLKGSKDIPISQFFYPFLGKAIWAIPSWTPFVPSSFPRIRPTASWAWHLCWLRAAASVTLTRWTPWAICRSGSWNDGWRASCPWDRCPVLDEATLAELERFGAGKGWSWGCDVGPKKSKGALWNEEIRYETTGTAQSIKISHTLKIMRHLVNVAGVEGFTGKAQATRNIYIYRYIIYWVQVTALNSALDWSFWIFLVLHVRSSMDLLQQQTLNQLQL